MSSSTVMSNNKPRIHNIRQFVDSMVKAQITLNAIPGRYTPSLYIAPVPLNSSHEALVTLP